MSKAERPRLAVIAGPTASGKSARALALAQARGGVLINADASQLYADLAVLSARPGAAEQARATHLLYGVVDGAVPVSAADWAARARGEVEAAWAVGLLPILVGGTGLYLDALLDGIAEVPSIDPRLRAAVRALDTDALRHALAGEDQAMAARVADPQRMARALEVVRQTGRSLAWWQARPTHGLAAQATVEALVLDPPRELLASRIEARFDAMLAAGALDEARRLAARQLDPGLPVMKAIGVPPLLDHLAGRLDLPAARLRALADTRRYTKRQRTWFVSGGRARGWLAQAQLARW